MRIQHNHGGLTAGKARRPCRRRQATCEQSPASCIAVQERPDEISETNSWPRGRWRPWRCAVLGGTPCKGVAGRRWPTDHAHRFALGVPPDPGSQEKRGGWAAHPQSWPGQGLLRPPAFFPSLPKSDALHNAIPDRANCPAFPRATDKMTPPPRARIGSCQQCFRRPPSGSVRDCGAVFLPLGRILPNTHDSTLS
jgi:hypothetical protein